eukprot:scaffold4475_cov42-Attheya_sp.AAC.6
MIEIKSKNNSWDLPQRRDFDKCIMLTASTAMVLSECGMEDSSIVLPFMIGRAQTSYLYVTVKIGEAIKILQVEGLSGFPIASDPFSRQKAFLALAVLLARFRSKFTGPIQNLLDRKFQNKSINGRRAFSNTKHGDRSEDGPLTREDSIDTTD